MLAYIIRLDDATPKMNKQGWEKVEKILDKYGIRPIVGIIPDNRDPSFIWEEDPLFWKETVLRWKKKEWTMAQHGCYHTYHVCEDGKYSEFIGLNYDEQLDLILHGNMKLKERGVDATCFFAPAHSFDDTTVDVCRDSGLFEFISDGYAFYPFVERDMLFLPRIFDTAHKILPFGVYTFVLHPNYTTEKELVHLEGFILKNQRYFLPVSTIIESLSSRRKRTIFERVIRPITVFLQKIRKVVRKIKG